MSQVHSRVAVAKAPKNKCSLCNQVGHNKNHCPQHPQPPRPRAHRRVHAQNRGGQFQEAADEELGNVNRDEDSNSEDENNDEDPGSDEERLHLDPFVAEDRRLEAELGAPVAPEPQENPFADVHWLPFEVEPLRGTQTRTGYSEESPIPESTYRYRVAQEIPIGTETPRPYLGFLFNFFLFFLIFLDFHYTHLGRVPPKDELLNSCCNVFDRNIIFKCVLISLSLLKK
jgi:hypothetical protein